MKENKKAKLKIFPKQFFGSKNRKVEQEILPKQLFGSKNRKVEQEILPKQLFGSKNRKGLSTIVASLLLVLLVIIMAGVVWGITKGIIDKNKDTSCFANYGKVILNNDYTCYTPVNELYDVQFSVSVGDIDIEGVVVTLIGAWGDKSFSIMRGEGKIISGLKNYDETISIKSPEKNAGLTYVATGVGKVDSIRIAPIIEGEQCDISDSINQIDNCLAFAS